MSRFTRVFLFMLLIETVLFSPAPAKVYTYNFSFFDVPGAISDTSPTGINGQKVVGFYVNNGFHGFIKQGSTFTTLDVPGATGTGLLGINGWGQIVGVYGSAAQNILHSFVYVDGNFTYLPDVPGAQSTEAHGINNNGQVIGTYRLNEQTRGFLYYQGSFTYIDVPSAISTEPRGINDQGWIVGSYQDSTGNYHGFTRLPAGSYTYLDVPGATNTQIYGINKAGMVSGIFRNSIGYSHGFVFDGKDFTPVTVSEFGDTRISGIDDLGRVVGQHQQNNVYHGFIATPRGFPSSINQLLLLD